MRVSHASASRRTPRLHILGPTTASLDGAPLSLGGPLQRTVLTLLITGRGHAISADRMIDAVWEGRPPPRATTSLQSYISNLRGVLEPDRPTRSPARLLVTAPPGYALRLPEESVDAWRFEARLRQSSTLAPRQALTLLDEALGWFHGPALAEVAERPWARAEVARLTALRIAAQETAIGMALRAGLPADAVARAEAFTRDQPLREEGWRLLALARWASGHPAHALAALSRARARLASVAGLDPGRALVELEQAVIERRTEVLRAEVPRETFAEVVRRPLPMRSGGKVSVGVSVLGPVTAELDGVAVGLGGPRQRAVLALLSTTRGKPVPTQRIISALWNDAPPPSAATALHAYMSNLRRILEPVRKQRAAAQVLVSTEWGYALRLPTEAVDAWRFEAAVRHARETDDPEESARRLEDALGLWRGPAYAEFADERWARAEAVRLEELRCQASEAQAEATLRAGRAASAVALAEVLTLEQPLRDEGWQLLIRALWAGGRQAEALDALRRGSRLLHEAFGRPPSFARGALAGAAGR